MRYSLIITLALTILFSSFNLQAQTGSAKRPAAKPAQVTSTGLPAQFQSKTAKSSTVGQQDTLRITTSTLTEWDMHSSIDTFTNVVTGGPDILTLSPNKKAGTSMQNGQAILHTYANVLVKPGTTGRVVNVKKNQQGEIVQLDITFWNDATVFLSFGPWKDKPGTFVLLATGTPATQVHLVDLDYTLIKGGGSDNPIFLRVIKEVTTDIVAPGEPKN